MAEKSGSDIFMYFCQDSTPLPGECNTELAAPGRPKNELLKGFEPNKMFEISSFNFGVGIKQEAVDDFEQQQMILMCKQLGLPPPRAKPKPKAPPKPKPAPGQPIDDTPVTVQPVTFTRSMDTASSLLLHHTIKRTYFKKVAIVKRKSAGGAAAGEAYLRMDFRGVLLTDASWSNEEPIKENYSFEARAITMRYRPQLEDGTLGASRIGFWSMVPDAFAADLS